MATISDIAAKAGVSRALVSRVINRKPGVGPETMARILSAMDELNYRPNTLARSLALHRTQTVGVVMDTLCMPYFFNLIYGLQDAGERLGYNIVFCSGRSEARLKTKYVDYFASGRADGLIVYGSHVNDQGALMDLVRRNARFVLIEGTLPGVAVNNMLVDNAGGAYAAAAHLVRSGYRRIVHFTGDMSYQAARDRLDGFRRAMAEYRIPMDESSVVPADFSEKAGFDAMQKLIRGGSLPDAVFCGSDRIAYGAIRAMAGHGLNAPGDVALIGFDDDPPADRDFRYPLLSTLRQPLYELGADSVRLLVENIENPDMEKVVKIYKPELVLRETCR